MAKTKIPTARRKKIQALIRHGKDTAKIYRCQHRIQTASLLDDLAAVAEEYLNNVISKPAR